MKKLCLQLYVIGPSVFSRVAVHHMNELIRDHPDVAVQLDVIDVLENPQAAEENKILATPTLIRSDPAPACRVIGDLSDREKISTMLGLKRKRNGAGKHAVPANKEESKGGG